MSFTWKFEKPVLKTTLTAGGYSWPSGTSDPTEDILKAQIDEIRENIDFIDDDGQLRCSSNYLTMDDCNATYTANCPAVLIGHYGTRYGGQCPSYRTNYNATVCLSKYDHYNDLDCSAYYGRKESSAGGCRLHDYCSNHRIDHCASTRHGDNNPYCRGDNSPKAL